MQLLDKAMSRLRQISERLVETLDSSMPSEKADAIVADAILEIRNEIVGDNVEIVNKINGIACGSFGGMRIGKYEIRDKS